MQLLKVSVSLRLQQDFSAQVLQFTWACAHSSRNIPCPYPAIPRATWQCAPWWIRYCPRLTSALPAHLGGRRREHPVIVVVSSTHCEIMHVRSDSPHCIYLMAVSLAAIVHSEIPILRVRNTASLAQETEDDTHTSAPTEDDTHAGVPRSISSSCLPHLTLGGALSELRRAVAW